MSITGSPSAKISNQILPSYIDRQCVLPCRHLFRGAFRIWRIRAELLLEDINAGRGKEEKEEKSSKDETEGRDEGLSVKIADR